MHKLLICILITALYTSSVEALSDYHGHASGGGETVLVDHDNEHDSDGCDHCCHLSGHLLGIISAGSGADFVVAERVRAAGSPKRNGRATEPPTPPPNIRFLTT